MPHKAFSTLVILFTALVIFGVPLSAKAQNSTAEVEIDMTVLGGIEPAAGDKTVHSTSLSRPIDRPARPSLTQPTITTPPINKPQIKTPEIASPGMRPVISKPVEAAPIKVKGADVPSFRVYDERPKISHADELEPKRVDPDAKVKPRMPSKTKPKIVSFPIQEKKRSDSTDPSLASEDMNDIVPHAGSERNITEKLSAISPVPTLKPMAVPAASAEEEYIRTKQATTRTFSEIDADLPVPSRKPAKMLASSSFVKTSRVYAVKDVKDISKKGMAMPALPARRVEAEPLKAPPDIGLKLDRPGSRLRGVQNDDLARKLVTPNKMQMVESIEKVAALADKIHNSSKAAGQRVVYNTDMLDTDKLSVPKLAKLDDKAVAGSATHPVFAIPVEAPLPERKPIMARLSSVALDADSKPTLRNITAVEPAAGTEEPIVMDITEEQTPKPHTDLREKKLSGSSKVEENFSALAVVNLPYDLGQTDVTNAIKEKLDQIIITQLRADPLLRMQIHAFARSDGNTIKNARRASLTRALALRDYLMKQGIEAKRIDVRALGDQKQMDQVDLLILDPST